VNLSVAVRAERIALCHFFLDSLYRRGACHESGHLPLRLAVSSDSVVEVDTPPVSLPTLYARELSAVIFPPRSFILIDAPKTRPENLWVFVRHT